MSKTTQAAAAGIIVLGVLGCSPQSETTVPSVSTSPSSVVVSPVSRQDVQVTVTPAEVVGGSAKNVHISARCPLPQGGSEYRATARSDAFTGLVTLMPLTNGSAAPSPTAAAVPDVRGSAVIRADAEPGRYQVQVRCEATNDLGTGTFTIAAPAPAKTEYPTKAPQAGGGGTAASGPEHDSGPSRGVIFLALAVALAVGGGVLRRRSGA